MSLITPQTLFPLSHSPASLHAVSHLCHSFGQSHAAAEANSHPATNSHDRLDLKTRVYRQRSFLLLSDNNIPATRQARDTNRSLQPQNPIRLPSSNTGLTIHSIQAIAARAATVSQPCLRDLVRVTASCHKGHRPPARVSLTFSCLQSIAL